MQSIMDIGAARSSELISWIKLRRMIEWTGDAWKESYDDWAFIVLGYSG
jgi:hypothetical protein